MCFGIFASMRPWHFSHGNLSREVLIRGESKGFNEAVAFQPRKSENAPLDPAHLIAASMRPWHFSHGNYKGKVIKLVATKLQ